MVFKKGDDSKKGKIRIPKPNEDSESAEQMRFLLAGLRYLDFIEIAADG